MNAISRSRLSPAGFLLVTFSGLLLFAAAALAADPGRADLVRSYNAQVLQLQAQARGAAGAAAKARASEVLAERAAALRQLMASDPAAAERLAFPADVLEQLAATFPAAAASLEQRGHWDGELEYTIEDSPDLSSHRSVFRLHRPGEVLDLHFATGEPPGLRSGRKVKVGGVRADHTVVATEMEVTDAAMDGGDMSATGSAPYPAQCVATGPQSVLAVLVNLKSYSLPSGMTQDFVRGALLGNAYAGSHQNNPDWSVSDFWEQSSDGQTFIDPAATEVRGPITMASDYNTSANGDSFCDYNKLGSDVIAAVDSQVDFKRYARILIVMPNNNACTWAGVANVGCRTLNSQGEGNFTASTAWQKSSSMGNRSSAVQLTTHEMGHNLGMSHASSRDFGAEALGPLGAAGTLSEYGDTHSTMGSWNFGFYAASHAANQLRWLGLNSNYQVVESGGTYTIQNYEGRPAGVKALKVRRGTGNDAWLWIESRQNTGIYSSRLNSSLFSGALIHYQDSTTGIKSHLLDFTTATSSFADAALPVGQTWTDPYSNVNITVNSVQPTALTVTVNYGALPCVAAAPTVTASPTSASVQYGNSTTFDLSVKSNSSSGCAAEAINLAASAPAGWTASLGSSSLTVSPGQTSQTTLTVGVPAPHALGTYTVSATASTAAGSSTASPSVTVLEPVNRLSLTIGGNGGGSVAFSTPVKTCSSSCVTDYPKSTAPAVTLTAQPANKSVFTGWSGACSGTALTCTVTMSADRSVTATFSKSTGGSTGGGGTGGGGKGGGKPK